MSGTLTVQQPDLVEVVPNGGPGQVDHDPHHRERLGQLNKASLREDLLDVLGRIELVRIQLQRLSREYEPTLSQQ